MKKDREREKETKDIGEGEAKSVEVFDKVEGKEVPLAFSYELVESYFDGLATYLLLKIREGAVSCYMVAQVGSCESSNMFILPTEYLSSGTQVTSVLLRVDFTDKKHLILITEQGEICFINYHARVLQAKVAFGIKPPRFVQHDYQNSVYAIVCERKVYILDDLTLNIKYDVGEKEKGPFEAIAFSLDGKFALVEQNKLVVRDLQNKAYKFELTTGESKIESIKFSSLGLYLTAKLVNPYGVAVWMLDKPESLFTFNENLKFADFFPLDGSLR